MHHSINKPPYSLILIRHPPRPTTTGSPSPLPADAINATDPAVLRQKLLAKSQTMKRKLSNTLQKQQKRYKRYFDRDFRAQPTFQVVQLIYVDRPPLPLLAEDTKRSPLFNRLLPQTAGTSKILEIKKSVITINDDGIPSTISIDHATPVGNEHRRQNTGGVFQPSSAGPQEGKSLHDSIHQNKIVVDKIVGHSQTRADYSIASDGTGTPPTMSLIRRRITYCSTS